MVWRSGVSRIETCDFHQKLVSAYLVDAAIEGYPAGWEGQAVMVIGACLLGVLWLTLVT